MEVAEIITRLEVIYNSYGLLIVFLSSLIEITPMGWMIPGGVLLAAGGFFAYDSSLSLFSVLVVAWFGAWISFLLAYLLGYKTGYRVVKKLNQEENAKKAKILLKRHGGKILTTSMMANLTRFWIAYVAGAQKYNLLDFIRFSGIASLAWSSLMVVAGYLAGNERGLIEKWITRFGILSWVLVILATWVIYRSIKKEFGLYKGKPK